MVNIDSDYLTSTELARIAIRAFTPLGGESPIDHYRRVLSLDIDINRLDNLVTFGRLERERLRDPKAELSLMLAPAAALADAVDVFLIRCGDQIVADVHALIASIDEEAEGAEKPGKAEQ